MGTVIVAMVTMEVMIILVPVVMVVTVAISKNNRRSGSRTNILVKETKYTITEKRNRH
jgi:hypothetical protein